jgi:hypothetical protein
MFTTGEHKMSNEFRLLDTGEKSKVVTFRLGETVYQALEKLANETGGTVSATARKLLLESLAGEPMLYRAGDTLQATSTDTAVFIVGEYFTEQDIKSKLKKLVEK